MSRSTKYSVYILRNDKNKLYIGQSRDLDSRLQRHKVDGTLFVRNDSTYRLVYEEKYQSLLAAMRREKQLKGWTGVKKEALIAGDLELLKRL